MRTHYMIFLIGILACAIPSSAETLQELKAKMDKVAQDFNGTLGYSLHFRGSPQERISFNGDEIFPSASTIKTAVMCEGMRQVEQGKVKWTDSLEVQKELSERQAGGFAYHFREGTSLPLGRWVNIMITVSDNTATMLLREHLGQANVNDWLSSNGFMMTKLLNGKKCDELGLRELQQKWGLGMTTPNEMVRLFELIVDGKAGSKTSCERMLRILSQQYWDDLILSQAAPDVFKAAKSGALNRHRSDVAVVNSPGGQYVLAVYTKDQEDTRWTKDNEGNVAIRTLAGMVWTHYNPDHTWQPTERLLP